VSRSRRAIQTARPRGTTKRQVCEDIQGGNEMVFLLVQHKYNKFLSANAFSIDKAICCEVDCTICRDFAV
jgi:hypothetical protein